MLILANEINFNVIVVLREDPLLPGILDVFFFENIVSCASFSKRVYILKNRQNSQQLLPCTGSGL